MSGIADISHGLHVRGGIVGHGLHPLALQFDVPLFLVDSSDSIIELIDTDDGDAFLVDSADSIVDLVDSGDGEVFLVDDEGNTLED